MSPTNTRSPRNRTTPEKSKVKVQQKGLKMKTQIPGHPGNAISQSIGIGDLKDPKAGDPCLKGDLLRIGMDQCMTGSMDRKEVQCPLGVGRVLGEAVCPQGPLPGKTMPQGAIVFYFIYAMVFKIDLVKGLSSKPSGDCIVVPNFCFLS